MATCIPFQTQLSSIMEVMVKTAVAEISKLVDDKCAYLHLEISRKHLEISRKQTENDMLRKKLLMMQKVNNTQMHRGLEDYIERDADVGTSCPEPTGDLKLSEIEDPTAQFTIKEESPDEALWTSSPVEPVGNGVQYNSTSTERHCLEKDRHLSHMEVSNRATPNKFHDSHNSALHRDRPTSALQFTVKTEKQEEDPLGFNRNRCQQGAGKQNQLPAVFAVEERDNQLWSSIIEGNDIDAGFPDFSSIVEEYSKGFTDHSYTQNVGATNKSNGGPQASVETACNGSYNAEYDKDNPQPQPSSFLPRPQATYSEQDGQSEQLFSQRNINSGQPSENSERDYTAITDRPLDSQPHSTFRSGNLHLPHRMSSGPSRGYMCTHCGKAFNRLHHLKLHQQSHKRKRAFVCTICGKSFQCSSHLRIHYRTHTGEKPYCCGQCGKRFSQQSSLGVHLRTHSGERPYSCGQCGKSFILLHHLKRHRVIHTYS